MIRNNYTVDKKEYPLCTCLWLDEKDQNVVEMGFCLHHGDIVSRQPGIYKNTFYDHWKALIMFLRRIIRDIESERLKVFNKNSKYYRKIRAELAELNTQEQRREKMKD